MKNKECVIVLQLKYRKVLRLLREDPISWSKPSSLYRHLPTTLTLVTHQLASCNLYDSEQVKA